MQNMPSPLIAYFYVIDKANHDLIGTTYQIRLYPSDHNMSVKAMPLKSVFLLFSLLGCKNAQEHTKTDLTGDFMALIP